MNTEEKTCEQKLCEKKKLAGHVAKDFDTSCTSKSAWAWARSSAQIALRDNGPKKKWWISDPPKRPSVKTRSEPQTPEREWWKHRNVATMPSDAIEEEMASAPKA
jgi:hypothetical protein